MSRHVSYPKPRPVLESRIVARRLAEAKGRAFRDAVWSRDRSRCQYCGRRVFRMLDALPERGECHHLRGRRVAPRERYNPKQAILLCLLCHLLAQRHEITIKAPR